MMGNYKTERQKAALPEQYIINPDSGKWVLRDSTAGRKIANGIPVKQLLKEVKDPKASNPDDFVVTKEIVERSEMLYRLFRGLTKNGKMSDKTVKKHIEGLKLGYLPVSPVPMKWGGTGMDPYVPKAPHKWSEFSRLTKNSWKFQNGRELSAEYDRLWWNYLHEFNILKSSWWAAFVLGRRKETKIKLPNELWRMVLEMTGDRKELIINPGRASMQTGYFQGYYVDGYVYPYLDLDEE